MYFFQRRHSSLLQCHLVPAAVCFSFFCRGCLCWCLCLQRSFYIAATSCLSSVAVIFLLPLSIPSRRICLYGCVRLLSDPSLLGVLRLPPLLVLFLSLHSAPTLSCCWCSTCVLRFSSQRFLYFECVPRVRSTCSV